MMKILQVVPFFPPAEAFGGPVKVAYQTAKELVKRKHEVVVYTSDAKDFGSRLRIDSDNVIDGIRVHYFRNVALTLVKKFKLFVTPQLVSRAKEEVKKFDVIHLHEYRTFQNIVIAHYAKKYGVPYILQAHGSIPRIMAKQRLKRIYDILFGYKLLSGAFTVIALSRVEAEQYRSVGVPEEKIEVIPNGIDLSEYADLPSRGCFRKKFGIKEEEKIVLYLGRIHRVKGLDILVEAFARVIEDLDDVRLVIVGPDDGYLSKLEALINALSINDNVLILGPMYGHNKLEAYVDADVYILPSRYEAFSMSLLEAYACGKPVIASRVGGLTDTVVEGITGLLVETGDVRKLTRSMLSLLNDDDRAKEMGLRSKQFVKENFTIEKVVDKLEQLYQKCDLKS